MTTPGFRTNCALGAAHSDREFAGTTVVIADQGCKGVEEVQDARLAQSALFHVNCPCSPALGASNDNGKIESEY